MKKYLILLTTALLILTCSCKKSFERKQTLTVLLSKPVNSVNPFKAKSYNEHLISRLIARGFFYYDYANAKVRKSLLKDFSVSSNGKIWTFKIKNNIRTTSGDKITANFIYINFIKLLKKSYKNKYFKNVKKIKKVSSKKLKFYLNKPDYDFDTLFCAKTGFGFVAYYPDKKIKFQGYGPYKLVEFTPYRIVLKRNPDFKEYKVETENIIFIVEPDSSKRMKMLVNREADIGTISKVKDLISAQTNPYLRMKRKIVAPGFFVVASNAYPFNKKKIRLAILGNSLMKNKFVYSVYDRYAKLKTSILPRYSKYYSKFNYLAFYNPKKVKKTMAEAGIKGFKFKLHFPQKYPELMSCMRLWIKQLKKMNIETVLYRHSLKKLKERIKHNKFGLAVLPVNPWIVHPVNIDIYNDITKSENIIPAKFLKKIHKAKTKKDKRIRRRMNYEAMKDILFNARIIGIMKQPHYYVTTNRIQNMSDLLNGMLGKVRVYR